MTGSDRLAGCALDIRGLVPDHAGITLPRTLLDASKGASPSLRRFRKGATSAITAVSFVAFVVVALDVRLIATEQPVQIPSDEGATRYRPILTADLLDSAAVLFLAVRRAHRFNQIAEGRRSKGINALTSRSGKCLVGILPLLLAFLPLLGIERSGIGIGAATPRAAKDKLRVPRRERRPSNEARPLRIDDGELLIKLVSMEAFAKLVGQRFEHRGRHPALLALVQRIKDGGRCLCLVGVRQCD